jgi:phosphohistidine phosphatase
VSPIRSIPQAAAIPFRRQEGRVEYCLITSSSQSDFWTIPKGTIEVGDTAEITALKEAEEEAGLQGRVVGECLGTFDYQKNGMARTVAVYLMQVDHVMDRWDESHIRKRQWVNAAEATRILTGHPAATLFESALAAARALA